MKNNFLPVVCLLSGLALSSSLALNSKAHAANLVDVYQLAADNDPQLKAAEAARMAELEAKPQARALLFPNIAANANATRNSQRREDSSFFPVADEDFNSHGYTLSVTQPIYHHDYIVGLRQADSQIAKAEADFQAARQDLVVRVSESYFQVLGAIDNLEFARAEKSAVSRQLEQAKQRFEVGLIAITDVHEAQARYDLTVSQEIAAENLLANSREALREITGQYHADVAGVAKNIPLIKPDPENVEQWLQKASEHNPGLAAARASLDSAREEINRQRAGHYPTLDLVARRSNSVSKSDFGSETNSDTLALELNVPIYQGGLVSSKKRAAEYQHDQARHTVEQTRRSVDRQTRDAYLGVLAGIAQVKALKQAVVSNEKALEATNAGFEVGTRTIVDVLVSQQELFRARRDFARSRYDYILNSLRLKRAAGILSPADVRAIKGWLK